MRKLIWFIFWSNSLLSMGPATLNIQGDTSSSGSYISFSESLSNCTPSLTFNHSHRTDQDGNDVDVLQISGDIDKETLSKLIVGRYCTDDRVGSRLQPYLERNIQKHLDSPTNDGSDHVRKLHDAVTTVDEPSDESSSAIRDIILESTRELVSAQEHRIQELENRWPKKKSAMLAAATTVATTGMTLLFNYLTKTCPE